MALSTVHFRMLHGSEAMLEPVHFSGNGITLLDLKAQIIEKKRMSGAIDFDLKIIDLQDKGWFASISILLSVFINRFPT
jgi:hypothetical protein